MITWLVSFIPYVKRYWQYVVMAILVIYIGVLHFMLIKEENSRLTCKNSLQTIEAKLAQAQALADTKKEYAEKIIEKEVVKYKDRVKYIKETKIENSCDSAFLYLRSNF